MLHSLVTKSLTKHYWQSKKRIDVLSNIDITFEQGKSYAITGVSGSGKSTLLHILGGLDKPSGGSVSLDQKDIFTLNGAQKETFLNHAIGFVFQFHYLIKELTVLENVLMKALISGDDYETAQDKALKLLQHIGLADKVQAYPTQLSGGEQQRISIARALVNKPAFLLADEPTGNLDADNAHMIVELFKSLQQESGMGIIICTHDQAVYEKMGTVLKLHEGSLSPR